jgi:two-component system copper resistance phosphate regulon response regulator CusR
MKLLVIEDSQRLLRSLGRGFQRMGYTADLVADGNEAMDYIRCKDYDVIVLDLLLPGMDGLSILRHLRDMKSDAHVLILSARDRVEDRIRGLELGADDYMVKPFSFEELCARIQTLVRRRHHAKNPEVSVGPITINTAARSVRRDGDDVNLTPAEYALLECLVLHRGRVLSKERLLEEIHNSDSFAGVNVIEVMICNLRKKLGVPGEEPVVKTRRGFGYLIE